MTKYISILGSTGSIGRSALSIFEKKKTFKLNLLSANSNKKMIIYQIRKYKPKLCLVIGCIVKGESQHYEFLASTTINAIRNVAFENNIPVLNGVLTVESDQQAIDRAGKKLNKGAEYADASLDILNFLKKFDV